MGDPRRLKKKFKSPNKLWDKTRLEEELRLIGEYGLRNKREIWRHKTYLSRIRQQGREIQAAPPQMQQEAIVNLIGRLHRLGILEDGQDTIDDVLNLKINHICNRRLQTFVYRKGLARSVNQARQLIVHKHVAIDGQVVDSPSHLVRKTEENLIDFAPGSPFHDPEHPLRQDNMDLVSNQDESSQESEATDE
ncbi:30S ribosomal protein S4 [Candidatus Bathyarchaeota archaeon]|nr:30S ribosomal protein S4 [Candidatus Bathyarchaeota archaeon]